MDCHSIPEATESQLAELLGTTNGDNKALGLQLIFNIYYKNSIYIYI